MYLFALKIYEKLKETQIEVLQVSLQKSYGKNQIFEHRGDNISRAIIFR